jgi:hypothetical protein
MVFYKGKWGVVHNDFKQLFDCMNKIWHNIEYWNLTPQEKNSFNLTMPLQQKQV